MDKAVFSIEKNTGKGIVYKDVLLRTDISAQAKGLYAYLASYGRRICPSRDRILHDLGIQKDTYYSHRDSLVSAEILTVGEERSADGRHLNNTYGLPSYDGGFGWVGRDVMSDPDLGLRAKALYAIYCVFADATGSSSVKKSDILYFLGIGEDAYLSAKRELLDGGHILSAQGAKGRFGMAVVTVSAIASAHISDSAPCRENQDTAEKYAVRSDRAVSDNKNTIRKITSHKSINLNKTPDNIIPMPLLKDDSSSGTEVVSLTDFVRKLSLKNAWNLTDRDCFALAGDAAKYGRTEEETGEILSYAASHATSGMVGYARTLLRSYSRPVSFNRKKAEAEAKMGMSNSRHTDYNEIVMQELFENLM